MKNNNKYGWNNAEGDASTAKIIECQNRCPKILTNMSQNMKCKQQCFQMYSSPSSNSNPLGALKDSLKNQSTAAAEQPNTSPEQAINTENNSGAATTNKKNPLVVIGITVGAAVLVTLVGYAIYKKVNK